ncbi:MAG: alpha/beta fold hydrolase [Streptosporangiaceae bacterium]|nr:alpha/beta fold hydrolase [Streptosporangiaceae bacterium]MBV9855688.1 alpha/beta fold hydrolase [Streptosporangiaceae bacterium]
MTDVQAGAVRLAYRVRGQAGAPPVVLLHSLGDDSSDWDEVAAALAASYRVYAIDLRGHGESDWPGEYTAELLTGDVAAFLGALGLGEAAVIGHSLGGVVGYLLASRYPGRVTRLVLEDPAPPWSRPPRAPSRPDGPLSFDWAVTTMVPQANDPPQAWRDGLAAITAPTLIVAGGPESHISQDRLRDMAGLIPRCELITIPAGHFVHASRPAEFMAAVTAFLRRDGGDVMLWARGEVGACEAGRGAPDVRPRHRQRRADGGTPARRGRGRDHRHQDRARQPAQPARRANRARTLATGSRDLLPLGETPGRFSQAEP